MTVGAINPNILKPVGLDTLFKPPGPQKIEMPKPDTTTHTAYIGYNPWSLVPSTFAYTRNMEGNHLPTVNDLA